MGIAGKKTEQEETMEAEKKLDRHCRERVEGKRGTEKNELKRIEKYKVDYR